MILANVRSAARVTLPTPRFTRTGLTAWRAATTVPLNVPNAPPERWTTLFNVFGPRLVIAQDYQGMYDVIDDDFLRTLHRELGGGPGRGAHRALLLTAPIAQDRPLLRILRRLLRGDGYGVRHRAALMLGHLGATEAMEDLIRQLKDTDNDARRGAAEALGWLGDKRAAVALAKEKWDEGDDSVNAARIDAIDRLDAWDDVAAELEHGTETATDRFVLAAQTALAEGEPGELGELLASGGDPTWQRMAAAFVSRHPTLVGGAVDALMSTLREGGDEMARIHMAQSLGQCGEEMVEHVGELLSSDSWEVKMFACIAAACSPEIVGALRDELREKLKPEEDSDVRREAALALMANGVDDPLARAMATSLMTRRYQCLARASDVSAEGLAVVAMLSGLTEPTIALAPVLAATTSRGDQSDLATLLLALAEPELAGPTLEGIARGDGGAYSGDIRRYAAAGCLLADHAPRHLAIGQRLMLTMGDREMVDIGLDEALTGHASALAALVSRDNELNLSALRMLRALGLEVLRPYRDILEADRRRSDREDLRDEIAGMLQGLSAGDAASALADLLTPMSASVDATRAFLLLQESAPAVARLLAREFVFQNNRMLAKATLEALSESLDATTAEGLLRAAMGHLSAGDWVVRETACELFGRVPAEFWPEGLIEEVDPLLRERVKTDDDNDVKNAARASLAKLDREPVDETVPDEEPADEGDGSDTETVAGESGEGEAEA